MSNAQIVNLPKEISEEAMGAISAHLNIYSTVGVVTVLNKTDYTITLSYESKVHCKYSIVDAAKEQIVFIPGDGAVDTIVVAFKLTPEQPQTKESIMTETNTAATPDQTTSGFVSKMAKAATYISAATAVGIGGFYLWKKFGKAE